LIGILALTTNFCYAQTQTDQKSFITAGDTMLTQSSAVEGDADKALEKLAKNPTYYFGDVQSVKQLVSDIVDHAQVKFDLNRVIEVTPRGAISVRLYSQEGFTPVFYQFVILNQSER
jgi:hypothetical protein